MTPYNGYSFGHSLSAIAQAVQTQAQMMSFLDIFWLLGIVALCLAPLALLLPNMPRGAAPGH